MSATDKEKRRKKNSDADKRITSIYITRFITPVRRRPQKSILFSVGPILSERSRRMSEQDKYTTADSEDSSEYSESDSEPDSDSNL